VILYHNDDDDDDDNNNKDNTVQLTRCSHEPWEYI